jgi:hypothetical protein
MNRAFSAGDFGGARIPGALPQARMNAARLALKRYLRHTFEFGGQESPPYNLKDVDLARRLARFARTRIFPLHFPAGRLRRRTWWRVTRWLRDVQSQGSFEQGRVAQRVPAHFSSTTCFLMSC